MFKRLRELGRHPTQEQLQGALREIYLTVFALLAAPGLLLGALLSAALGESLRLPLWSVLALGVLALVLALLVAWLALRARQREDTPLAGAVRSSVQLASAPAVPFLMGCVLLGQPSALGALWGLSTLLLLGGLVLLRP